MQDSSYIVLEVTAHARAPIISIPSCAMAGVKSLSTLPENCRYQGQFKGSQLYFLSQKWAAQSSTALPKANLL